MYKDYGQVSPARSARGKPALHSLRLPTTAELACGRCLCTKLPPHALYPNTCGHSPKTLHCWALEFSGEHADSKPGCMAVRSSKRHPGDLLICDSWSTLVPQFGLLTRQKMRATRPQCGFKQAPNGPESLPGSLTLDSCSTRQHMCLATCSPHKSAHSP